MRNHDTYSAQDTMSIDHQAPELQLETSSFDISSNLNPKVNPMVNPEVNPNLNPEPVSRMPDARVAIAVEQTDKDIDSAGAAAASTSTPPDARVAIAVEQTEGEPGISMTFRGPMSRLVRAYPRAAAPLCTRIQAYQAF